MSDQLPHDEDLRSLYRKLPADEPRAEVDEAILGAAREVAAQASRQPNATSEHERQRSRFLARMRWMLPLAAAASVILTFSLARLTPEQPSVPATASLDEARDVVSMPSLGAAPQAEEEKQAMLADEDGRDAPESAPAPDITSPESAKDSEADSRIPPVQSRRDAEAAAKAATGAMAEARAKSERRAEAAADGAGTGDDAAQPKTQEKKTEAGPSAKGAEPSGTAGEAGRVNPEVMESLRSFGYVEGGGAPQRPASPPPPPAAAAPVSPPPDTFASPPAAAAPALPHSDALAREAQAAKANADEQARGRAANQALAKAAAEKPAAEASLGARADKDATAAQWPFGLAPRMAGDEACRLVLAATGMGCRFDGRTAIVDVTDGAVIDRGEFAGRKVTRIELVAEDGKLARIVLRIEGFSTDQILVAPR